jgi:hypothetical protein
MLLLAVTLTLASIGQATCSTIPDSAPMQLIGRFSDMEYTEEHAYGHTVELWRAGSCVVGMLEVSDGLAGDTPAGLLTEVRYNDGDLAFTAKLTTGMTTAPGSSAWVPSRDLFVFTGLVTRRGIKGKLRRSNQLAPRSAPVERELLLGRLPEDAASAGEVRTYGGWRQSIGPILRFRGPKW